MKSFIVFILAVVLVVVLGWLFVFTDDAVMCRKNGGVIMVYGKCLKFSEGVNH